MFSKIHHPTFTVSTLLYIFMLPQRQPTLVKLFKLAFRGCTVWEHEWEIDRRGARSTSRRKPQGQSVRPPEHQHRIPIESILNRHSTADERAESRTDVRHSTALSIEKRLLDRVTVVTHPPTAVRLDVRCSGHVIRLSVILTSTMWSER